MSDEGSNHKVLLTLLSGDHFKSDQDQEDPSVMVTERLARQNTS